MFLSRELDFHRKKKTEIVELLISKSFTQLRHVTKVKSTLLGYKFSSRSRDHDGIDLEPKRLSAKQLAEEFNYLLSLPLWSLSQDKVDELKSEQRLKR